MAKQQSASQKPQAPQPAKRPPAPAPRPSAAPRESVFNAGSRDFIYGRKHMIIFGAGLLLVLAGLAAMTGGAQPNPNEWDESVIYSARRITLAPILMVAGFVVVIYGIFLKGDSSSTETPA